LTTYLDTSAPGSAGPVSATGQVYAFGAEIDFFISIASNLISSQATGPSVEFVIYSRKAGPQTIQVDYGTTNTTYQVKQTGYLINVIVPSSVNAVSCRVVISSEPFPLTVQTIAAVGSVTVSGTIDTDLGQANAGANLVTPLVPNTHLGPLDLPGDSNFAYTPVAKASQLPAALVGGGLNIRTITEALARSWNLSASDLPRLTDGTHALNLDTSGFMGIGYGGSQINPQTIRALTSADNVTAYGSGGFALQQDNKGNLFMGLRVPGTTSLQYSGGPIFVDSSGNVSHGQYLPGTATPIYTAQLLQDSGGRTIHKLQGHQTSVGHLNENGSIVAGTVITAIGTIVCGAGSTLHWSLAVFGTITTAGSAAAMTVTGNTSATTYAICGPGNSNGQTDISSAETITFSYQNGDTVNHYMIGGIWVTNP